MVRITKHAKVNPPATKPIVAKEGKKGESLKTQKPQASQKIQTIRKVKVVRKKTEKPKAGTTKIVRIKRKVSQPGPRKKVRTNLDNKRNAENKKGQGETVTFGRMMMEAAGFGRRRKK